MRREPTVRAVSLLTCGAPAMGGACILPRGHNMGKPDVPGNHRAFSDARVADSARPMKPPRKPSLRFYRDSYNRVNFDIHVGPLDAHFSATDEPWDGPIVGMLLRSSWPKSRFIHLQISWSD